MLLETKRVNLNKRGQNSDNNFDDQRNVPFMFFLLPLILGSVPAGSRAPAEKMHIRRREGTEKFVIQADPVTFERERGEGGFGLNPADGAQSCEPRDVNSDASLD